MPLCYMNGMWGDDFARLLIIITNLLSASVQVNVYNNNQMKDNVFVLGNIDILILDKSEKHSGIIKYLQFSRPLLMHCFPAYQKFY